MDRVHNLAPCSFFGSGVESADRFLPHGPRPGCLHRYTNITKNTLGNVEHNGEFVVNIVNGR
jgi:flavin reductase (DIM6/NTAB) family NADH-FMN oxidoreductase RutF